MKMNEDYRKLIRETVEFLENAHKYKHGLLVIEMAIALESLQLSALKDDKNINNERISYEERSN